jgi:hypothetical protein
MLPGETGHPGLGSASSGYAPYLNNMASEYAVILDDGVAREAHTIYRAREAGKKRTGLRGPFESAFGLA